jgi:hypothetical protein
MDHADAHRIGLLNDNWVVKYRWHTVIDFVLCCCDRLWNTTEIDLIVLPFTHKKDGSSTEVTFAPSKNAEGSMVSATRRKDYSTQETITCYKEWYR